MDGWMERQIIRTPVRHLARAGLDRYFLCVALSFRGIPVSRIYWDPAAGQRPRAG